MSLVDGPVGNNTRGMFCFCIVACIAFHIFLFMLLYFSLYPCFMSKRNSVCYPCTFKKQLLVLIIIYGNQEAKGPNPSRVGEFFHFQKLLVKTATL